MQENLNDALIAATAQGNSVGTVQRLLAEGADVNCLSPYGRSPLIYAAMEGRLEIVKVLLEAGADRSYRDKHDMAAEDYAHPKYPTVVTLLRDYIKDVPTADEISFSRPISNRTLEEIFNFVSLERITLIRKGKYGPVEAVTRDSFLSIDDDSVLRKAFEEHVKRGGKIEESQVFSHYRISKSKLPKQE